MRRLKVIQPVWTKVKDEGTGRFYYWNKKTNQTTALDELPSDLKPPPAASAASPAEGQNSLAKRGGFLGMIYEGMAYG